MELTSEQEIAAPRAQVFAALTDFAAVEARMKARGTTLERLDSGTTTEGAEWEARFRLRGRERRLHLVLADCAAPEKLGLTGDSPAFAIESMITLAAPTPETTRMRVTFIARPRTTGARLALQSLRLVRGRMERRFDAAVARLAEDVARA